MEWKQEGPEVPYSWGVLPLAIHLRQGAQLATLGLKQGIPKYESFIFASNIAALMLEAIQCETPVVFTND